MIPHHTRHKFLWSFFVRVSVPVVIVPWRWSWSGLHSPLPSSIPLKLSYWRTSPWGLPERISLCWSGSRYTFFPTDPIHGLKWEEGGRLEDVHEGLPFDSRLWDSPSWGIRPNMSGRGTGLTRLSRTPDIFLDRIFDKFYEFSFHSCGLLTS